MADRVVFLRVEAVVTADGVHCGAGCCHLQFDATGGHPRCSAFGGTRLYYGASRTKRSAVCIESESPTPSARDGGEP